jgi:glycosyltransferase involved in cell wall biosynthesis
VTRHAVLPVTQRSVPLVNGLAGQDMREALLGSMPTAGDAIPHTHAAAEALLARIEAAALALPRSRWEQAASVLGPALPARSIVRASKRRAAVLVVGYFPFRCCQDLVAEARSENVPCYVVPLFHPLEPLHHSPVQFDACRHATGLLCLSPFAKAYFGRKTSPDRTMVTGSSVHGIDARMISTRKSPRPPRFVFIGRNEAGKNMAEALSLVSELRAAGLPDAKLVVVSNIPLQEASTFPPFVEFVNMPTTMAMARLLSDARALLFPSLLESFGQVVLEAIRVGTPVLVKESNLATASVLRDLGLEMLLYSSIEEAMQKATAWSMAPAVDVDLVRYTWPAIGQSTARFLEETSGRR